MNARSLIQFVGQPAPVRELPSEIDEAKVAVEQVRQRVCESAKRIAEDESLAQSRLSVKRLD